MEWEFPAPETREATRNAAITASTPTNRDLRIQHAMTGDVGHDQRREFARPALHDRGARRRYLCQKHSLPFIARRERRAMKNDENDAHSIETKIVIRNETRVVNASR